MTSNIQPDTKKLPPLPAGILAERMAALNLNQSDLARAAGVSRVSIHQILAGKTRLTTEMAVRIAHATDTDVLYWLRLQSELDVYETELRLAEELRYLPVPDLYHVVSDANDASSSQT